MVDPTDLLYLLAVARGRTHTAAAEILGVNHTTVARRLKALERSMSARLLVPAPDGWELTATGKRVLVSAELVEQALNKLTGEHESSAEPAPRGRVRVNSTEVFGLLVAVPALAAVHREYPGITFELTSVTRPSHTYGPASDLDIGVTRPASPRLTVQKLTDYELGIFASDRYVQSHPRPRSLADLAQHVPIYYVESMLQIADLDFVEKLFPNGAHVLGATSVLVQLELTRSGVGVGILPAYLARRSPDLVRILDDEASVYLTYWMSSRLENARRREVRLVAEAIERQVAVVFN